MWKEPTKIIAIAKFSQENYLHELVSNEELFLNTIDYFSNSEHQNYRFDDYEGCDRIYQPNYITEFKIDGMNIRLAENGPPVKIRLSTDAYFTHICCFTLISNKAIFRKKEQKVFDPRLFSFGNSFVISNKIRKILDSIYESCTNNTNISKWQICPVEYVDVKKHNGDWDVFHKPLKYKYQNELRLAIRVNCNEPYKLHVPGLGKLFLEIQNKDKCINKVINNVAIIS